MIDDGLLGRLLRAQVAEDARGVEDNLLALAPLHQGDDVRDDLLVDKLEMIQLIAVYSNAEGLLIIALICEKDEFCSRV